jgi:c(7)-type cytochrome triheme protein
MRTLFAALLMLTFTAGLALAVPAGKVLTWDSPQGKATFRGDDHAGKGLKCTECHNKIFTMKYGSSKFVMADLNAGKFCGECHNGTRAFATSDPANCSRCHKK